MKKKLNLFFVLMLAVTLVVAGCGGGQQPAPNEGDQGEQPQQQQSVEVTRLLMATGGTGGTYYPLGGSIANVWNDNIEGLNVTIEATGASVENLRLLGSGETDLIMSMNGPAMHAYNGTGDFAQPIDFAAVGVIYPEVMQIVAPKDSGIQSVEDLKGKRVSIGPAGSGTAAAALNILEAFDIDPDNDMQKFQDNFADAARKIKDGQLDAAFAVLAVPAGNVVDITTSTPVNIVNITGAGLDRLLELDPTFSPFEIPAGTYDGQDETGYTVSQWAVLYVPTDMDEDLVYNLTNVMYEKTADIARGHDRGNQITLDNAMEGIAPVPFHPGALKYYREKGLTN